MELARDAGMIRKLKSGQYRLYSRKIDRRTGKRRNLGTFTTRAAAERHERRSPDLEAGTDLVAGEQVDRESGIDKGDAERDHNPGHSIKNLHPGHFERRHADEMHAPDANAERQAANQEYREARTPARYRDATGKIEADPRM